MIIKTSSRFTDLDNDFLNTIHSHVILIIPCDDVLSIIANEATELRREVDSAADYNAAQCGQNPSNST